MDHQLDDGGEESLADERKRLRKLLSDGLASGEAEPHEPDDWAELRSIASDVESLGTLPLESPAECHARAEAARTDLDRGGASYSREEVLDEMRAMTERRRRQLSRK